LLLGVLDASGLAVVLVPVVDWLPALLEFVSPLTLGEVELCAPLDEVLLWSAELEFWTLG